jgi:hypothetical protein
MMIATLKDFAPMSRGVVLLVSLWIAVILMAIWLGGTVYQMVVIVPLWTDSLPESLSSFMHGTNFGHAVLNFFGSYLGPLRLVAIIVALVAGWRSPKHRAALRVAVASYLFIIALTVLYIYTMLPTILAGGASTVEETRLILERFILADRFRFVVGCGTFFAPLWAFRLPYPPRADRN